MRILFAFTLSLSLTLWAGIAAAQMTDEDQFVADNLTGTFYHELGHALVHQLDIPIYGQEEDAADVLAAYLIARWHKPVEAERIARAVALAFYADFIDYEDNGRDVYWAGVHGPALQRMFNHLCVFVGSDLDTFADLGRTFGLDENRLDTCDVEHSVADHAWGQALTQIEGGEHAGRIRFDGFSVYDNTAVGQWAAGIGPVVINRLGLPKDLPVRVEPCRQSNAFYDPAWGMIQMCTEQEQTHRDQFQKHGSAVIPQ